MDALSNIDDRADAVFGVDASHQLVAWSKGCENLLGFDARSVLGKHCYRIVCGTDAFANRFCDARCAVLNMVRHGEPVNSFELNLRTATGNTVRANISLLVVGQTPSRFALLHLLNPLPVKKQRGTIEA
jgi:PAS domain-containing protein